MPPPVEAPQRLEFAKRSARRIGDPLAWLLLFAAALAVRSLRFGAVATPSGVRFPSGADELYHMRRIWFTVVNFPASLDFDRYMNHPEGAQPIWTACFDWTIAAAARLLVGAGDQAAVERVAIWAPPVLGALAVLAAAALARGTFSPAAGWVTGVWLTLLPAHASYGSVGEIDHHVAVGLFATLLVAAAMRTAGPLAATGRPRGVVASGCAIAAVLLLWPGSLLHVLVVQAVLAVQLLATRDRGIARARASGLAAAHALAAALLLPFCAGRRWSEYGAVTPLVLSNFQPLWLGAGAVALALLTSLWGRTALGVTRARRIGGALGIAALGLAAAWLGVPGLAAAVRGGASWFMPDPFLREVAELEPLLFRGGRFDAALAHHYLSYWLWAYPLGAAVLVRYALREGRADVLLLVAWASAFCALTLSQQRFMDSSGAGFVLVLGPAFVLGFRGAQRRFAWPRSALFAAAIAAGLVALLPYAPHYRGDWQTSLAERRGVRLWYGPDVRQRRVLERVADWMLGASPKTAATRSGREAGLRRTLGLGQGHLLRYYSERPMVQDNFGPWGGRQGFDNAEAYYDSLDEEKAFEIAVRLRARYVVATPRGSGQHWPRRGSLATRLALRRDDRGGLAFPVSGERALAHHRLVFVADDADLARGGRESLGGRALRDRPRRPCDRHCAAEKGWSGPSSRSRSRIARRSATSRAPARTRRPRRDPPAVSERQPYLVRADERTASLALSEADVREGRTVAGPIFRERAIPTP